MSKHDKTREKILSGTSDANIGFDDACAMLAHVGFRERIRGSHRIFTIDGIEEILNLQPHGSQMKRYQVKQLRAVLARMPK